MAEVRSSTSRLNDFSSNFSEKISSSTLTFLAAILLQIAQQNQQERQAGQPLLPIHDVARAVLLLMIIEPRK